MKKTKATFLAGCATLAIATLSGSTAQAQWSGSASNGQGSTPFDPVIAGAVIAGAAVVDAVNKSPCKVEKIFNRKKKCK